MFSKSILAASFLLTLCTYSWAQAEASSDWHHNPGPAFEKALAQDASVLMLLRVEAYGETALADQASAAAEALEEPPVLIELVYPENSYAQPGISRQFIAWADRAGANALPALVWLDPNGRPHGIIAIDTDKPMLPQQLQDRLAKMSQRYQSSQAAFDQAQKRAGPDSAQQLHLGLQLIDEPCRAAYYDVMQEIVSLDPQDTLGLKQQYGPILSEVAVNDAIQNQVYPMIDAGAYAQAYDVLDGIINEHTLATEQHQLLMAFQAQLLHSQKLTEKAIAKIDEAIALDANSPVQEKLTAARLQFTAEAPE